MSLDAPTSLRVVNHIPAMVAYWNTALRCVFANDAYLVWFGRTPQEMDGMPMQQLLGPLFALNLPYIQGALGGTKQVFERQIKLPGGDTRETIATYTPDTVDGQVLGFSVHVADVTPIRQREDALEQTIRDAILALEKTKDSFRSHELGRLRQRLLQISRAVEENHRAARLPATAGGN